MTPRARGRPRAYDPDKAINAILRVFWINGFDATSLDDLSAATNMRRPSLYQAFGNKEQIYKLALERYRNIVAKEVMRPLVTERTLVGALESAFDAAISLYSSGDPPAQGCFELSTGLTVASRSREIAQVLAEGARWRLAIAQRRLDRAQREGDLGASVDIVSRALLLRSTFESLAIQAKLGTSVESLRQLAQASTALISCSSRWCGPYRIHRTIAARVTTAR